jgi:3D (Asp-Asp-Asp) domain-containing protein
VLATSYSPSTAGHKQPGDPFFGVSATGAEVVRGIVATDPRVIPLGTFLYVPTYGSGRALDVGGAVKGFRIDLGYDDANLVLWNTWVDVYLLVPVPSPDEMVWVLPEN